MTNQEVAKLLRNVAAAYSIKDEKKYRFQIIAYQKAASSIETLTKQLKDLYKEDDLNNIPGVGESIKNHLLELFKTGEVSHFRTVMGQVSQAVFPLLDIPSFGPKKAYKLTEHFNLTNPKTVIADIKKLAQSGQIAELDTFGEKSQKDILQALDEYSKGAGKTTRMVLPVANNIAQEVIKYLKKSKDVKQAYALGSLRRMKSTVGDVDLAVSSSNPQGAIEHFMNYPYKSRMIEKGTITASFLTSGKQQVDLMVLPPKQLGSLLQHFTGSKNHNVALREHAIKKGYSLSEKGIKLKNGSLKTFSSEEDFYNFLGMDWIAPEMRENKGEIELAIKRNLPKLVSLSDIKGDLHTHSNYPIEPSHDLGINSMQEMVDKALDLKYEYIGFSEHNPSVSMHTEKQIFSILSKRKAHIEQLNKSLKNQKTNNKNVRVINLLEVDILASGKIALPESCFDLVDAFLVSIHSSFGMEKKAMTERIIKGMSSPKAKILSHPTARMINNRPGINPDWGEIFEFVAKANKALEINSWPERLDLPDDLVFEAKAKNVKFIINTDSHAASQMDNMFYGVSVARRGWLTKNEVLNTKNDADFSSWINSK